MKGLKKTLDRIAWLVNAYIESRTKLGAHYEPLPSDVEEFYKKQYNFNVRDVSYRFSQQKFVFLKLTTKLEILHYHNVAIHRTHGLTNDLRVTFFVKKSFF